MRRDRVGEIGIGGADAGLARERGLLTGAGAAALRSILEATLL